jgi:hypothetical protein
MADLRLVADNRERIFYSGMSKDDLIGYCALHCRTERALFHKDMVAQMVEYAGCPKGFLPPEEISRDIHEFYSLHESMEELVSLARSRNSET